MRKDELIQAISDRTGLTRAEVRHVIDTFISIVKDQLINGDSVVMRGFGKFSVRTRKPRVARDINRNKPIHLPERRVPYFKPSEKFVKEVDKANILVK
ncbi:MAG: HU family DNA-binding protein [Chlorobi bacterium]|nr:HU family DNA-binding protein [Chlorobiota bacterium]